MDEKIGKEEAAKILGVSERTLERNAAKYQKEYGLKITYEQGRTKRVPVYDESQIRALAERLKSPVLTGQILPAEAGEERIATQTTQNDNGGAGVAIRPEAEPQSLARLAPLESLQTLEALLRAVRSPETQPRVDVGSKIMLTLADAAALSSLSEHHLREAVRAGRLKGKIIGRGWKVKRTDLDAYVKGL